MIRNMTTNLLPKTKSEWIVLLGFLVYFIADLAHDRFKFDLMNLTPKAALIEWMLRALRDWGLTAAIATMIIAGLRLIRKEGLTLKRMILPTVGVCIAGGWLCMSFYSYQKMMTVPDLHRTPDEVRKKMEANIHSGTLSLENKAKRSKFYAYLRFQEDGIQINYFTPDGKEELYNPTELEIKERNDLLKAHTIFKRAVRSVYLSMFFWVVVIVVSLGVGLLTPVKKEHPT